MAISDAHYEAQAQLAVLTDALESMSCENCDDRQCMACVLREIHDECVADCFTCVPREGVNTGTTGRYIKRAKALGWEIIRIGPYRGQDIIPRTSQL